MTVTRPACLANADADRPAIVASKSRVDILSGTYGKALGGAMGGFIAARQPVVDLLRQRARPYLFSNALAPSVCGAALAAIAISDSDEGDRLRERLVVNALHFRTAMADAGFKLLAGSHPIIPVMLGDAALAQTDGGAASCRRRLRHGLLLPRCAARTGKRIRVQMNAALTAEHIDHAVAAFVAAGRELGVIA